THQRRPLFGDDLGRRCLGGALREVKAKLPFEVFAIVLLPEHLHAIWVLPEGDAKYPRRWRQVKEAFTRSFLGQGDREGTLTRSRRGHRERAVWQRRFWEHTCRDEEDLKRCLDYVHYNPVKHGLVQNVRDYPFSSFHRFVQMGEYDLDWGSVNP